MASSATKSKKLNKRRPSGFHEFSKPRATAVLSAIVDDILECDEFAMGDLIKPENYFEDITDKFAYIRQLGKGASCRVLKVRDKKSNKLYALKELKRSDPLNPCSFRKEVELLKKLCHPNIVQFADCYMDDECLYIAFEFCSGGTLLDKILQMKTFSEQQASHYIRLILQALHYMHSLNIVHRDMKAQNIVFNEKGPNGVLRLIDFGDSIMADPKQLYTDFVGTIYYLPPCIMRPRSGQDLKKSDMWSVGVICYLLICGTPPFYGNDHKEILRKITQKNKSIPFPSTLPLSASCKDFIRRLLCDDIAPRYSAAQALQHPWISGDTAGSVNLRGQYLESLRKYDYNYKLQHILVDALLAELDTNEQEILYHGIMDMNKQRSTMAGDTVLDFLLVHSSVAVQSFGSLTSCLAGDKSKRKSIMQHSVEWSILDELDVDKILDEAEKESDDMKTGGVMDDNDEEMPVGQPTAKQARSISVETFKEIMAKTKYAHAVDGIVSELDTDKSGQISFDNIHKYHKHVESVDLTDTVESLHQ